MFVFFGSSLRSQALRVVPVLGTDRCSAARSTLTEISLGGHIVGGLFQYWKKPPPCRCALP